MGCRQLAGRGQSTLKRCMELRAWQATAKSTQHKNHSINYWDQGTGEPLLLIHGFPTASWDWYKIFDKLAQTYRVVAPDMIGFGFSDKPKDYEYHFSDQADLHERLCQSLKLGPVHILCHDYGNSVAQELLTRQEQGSPDLEIKSICYLNGGLFPEAIELIPIQRLLMGPMGALIAKLFNKERFSKDVSGIFGPETQPTPDELDQMWGLISHNDQKRIIHRLSRYQLQRKQNRDRWVGTMQNTSVPQRFVVGMHDPISGHTMAKRYDEIIPNPDVINLSAIGHWPQLEAPEEVLIAYSQFRDRI